ncbi:hypothetical protein Lal_00036006 [Lupinus albus]|uniref:Uncharacterized protein n=1 Tax=Lupinus albus TaxID=3870 RepID=A0A6A5M7S0_LUPAL|nr:hypothetical protein Lalb_Chr04g0248431 [Lupinus albus]KAF1868568.1 hypothetical protein Lal_00036006 [Lupinus albus]
MGNCIRHQSSTAEDGGSSSPTNDKRRRRRRATSEVKIKITKKQLEELLVKMEMKELRVEQVLGELMEMTHKSGYNSLHQPWKPALQSIPEVN